MKANGYAAAGALAALLTIGGCAEQPSKEIIGTGAGAVIGGAVGQEVGDGTAGAVIGGIIGAIAGREVGRRMDERDRGHVYDALQENERVAWRNEETDARYDVDPTETFYRDGRLCREFKTTITVEGDVETATGTACRRDDGTWEIVS